MPDRPSVEVFNLHSLNTGAVKKTAFWKRVAIKSDSEPVATSSKSRDALWKGADERNRAHLF